RGICVSCLMTNIATLDNCHCSCMTLWMHQEMETSTKSQILLAFFHFDLMMDLRLAMCQQKLQDPSLGSCQRTAAVSLLSDILQ
ncbi:unnamed protein product, partial [Bubo scandiacus]